MEQMEQIMEFDLFKYFNPNKSSIIKSMNEYQIASNSLHRISARSTKPLNKDIFHR